MRQSRKTRSKSGPKRFEGGEQCGIGLNLAMDVARAPTARVCPLIMAGKAAAVQDRDVPRPNCYIYAKRGPPDSVSLSYSRAHGVIKPSGPWPHLPPRGNACCASAEYPTRTKNRVEIRDSCVDHKRAWRKFLFLWLFPSQRFFLKNFSTDSGDRI